MNAREICSEVRNMIEMAMDCLWFISFGYSGIAVSQLIVQLRFSLLYEEHGFDRLLCL
jgi:hypothetical protein